MHESTEHILADLYELDPSLHDREVEVRALVNQLLEKKPGIILDPAFMTSLRTELVHTRMHPYHANHHSVRWWFMHIAPVGAIAVLMLTLMPSLMQETTVPNVAYETRTATTDVTGSPTAKQAGTDIESASFMVENVQDNTSPTGLTNTALTGETITALTQTPGRRVTITEVSLTASGFLLIKSGADQTLGTSVLLGAGTSTDVPIELSAPTIAGGSYYATLIHDSNGNGVLDSTDSPVFDPYTERGLPAEDRILVVPFDVVESLE